MVYMSFETLLGKMKEIVGSTLESYQSDFDKDIDQLNKITESEPDKVKDYIWAVRDMGTHLFDRSKDYDKERLSCIRTLYSFECSRYKEYCINFIPAKGWLLKVNE